MYKVTDLINHYNQLVFFALRRYESDNYAKMRKYFASIFIKLKSFKNKIINLTKFMTFINDFIFVF